MGRDIIYEPIEKSRIVFDESAPVAYNPSTTVGSYNRRTSLTSSNLRIKIQYENTIWEYKNRIQKQKYEKNVMNSELSLICHLPIVELQQILDRGLELQWCRRSIFNWLLDLSLDFIEKAF